MGTVHLTFKRRPRWQWLVSVPWHFRHRLGLVPRTIVGWRRLVVAAKLGTWQLTNRPPAGVEADVEVRD
jgi:hypothetical protein